MPMLLIYIEPLCRQHDDQEVVPKSKKHLIEVAPPLLMRAHLLTKTQEPRSQSVNGMRAE